MKDRLILASWFQEPKLDEHVWNYKETNFSVCDSVVNIIAKNEFWCQPEGVIQLRVCLNVGCIITSSGCYEEIKHTVARSVLPLTPLPTLILKNVDPII